jgi:hypothetical protein
MGPGTTPRQPAGGPRIGEAPQATDAGHPAGLGFGNRGAAEVWSGLAELLADRVDDFARRCADAGPLALARRRVGREKAETPAYPGEEGR